MSVNEPDPSVTDDAAPVEAAAARDQALYRFLVDSLTEYAVFAIAPDGMVMSWNAGAQQTFGFSAAEIVGRSFEIIFTDHDRDIGAPQAELQTALSGERTEHDRWHVRKDGARFWGTNSVQPLFGTGGALIGFTKLVRDTTEGHLALERLSDSEQQLRLLVESVRGYAIFSLAIDGTIASWNTAAQRVYGFTPEDVIGTPFAALFAPEDRRAGVPEAELLEASAHGSSRSERWQMRKDGTRFLASARTSRLMLDAGGDMRGFVKIAHDVTEQHAEMLDLTHRAQFDELTELPNRRTFYESIRRAIAAIKRRPACLFAVMFIDLDHFKAVNDALGHLVADQVLATAARRLEACVRAEDTVARIGGDEFAILLDGIGGVAEARDAAERMLFEMGKPIVIGGHTVNATASIGIAMGDAVYLRPEEVLRDADAAMYVAKFEGRARAVMFDNSARPAGATRGDLAADLRSALGRGDFVALYQPVLRLRDRAVIGYEALVRWHHPHYGLLSPSEFIGLAERSGLIGAIDHWMLVTACGQYAEWRRRGAIGPDVQMSVNVSSLEFARDDFLTELRDILATAGMPASALRLEITENAIMERSSRATALVAAIRGLGVSIDIDDFGTGYASLAVLQSITVDALKIDSSFVAAICVGRTADLIASIVLLAHALGLTCIAEGIETPTQLAHLEALGCDAVQGFLFAPPLDPPAVEAFTIA